MFKKIRHSRAGFTLIEMLVVLTIIGILMGISMFPYGVFMERARLSNSIDAISQGWILAHKEVRNGLEFSDGDATTDDPHAGVLLEFTPGEKQIKKYIFVPEDREIVDPTINETIKKKLAPDFSRISDSQIFQKKNDISFEGTIEIRSSEGISDATTKAFSLNNSKFFYVIMPPYAEGKFYDEAGQDLNLKEKTIVVGYPGVTNALSHAKEVLLHPYLQ